MVNLMERVKNFSAPMFILFVLSKVLVGIGVGVLLARFLAPYGWPILIAGILISAFCVALALTRP
ncbi:MAG: hypothetical protein PVH45_00455 [Candidatus Omnitrophota bacterium]|jgi:hypothetical protein